MTDDTRRPRAARSPAAPYCDVPGCQAHVLPAPRQNGCHGLCATHRREILTFRAWLKGIEGFAGKCSFDAARARL